MDKIMLSNTFINLCDLSLSERNRLYPEHQINAHEDKNEYIRYQISPNLEEEYSWFEDHFYEIYEGTYAFFSCYDSDEESWAAAYVLYIQFLYKKYKECPVSYEQFEEWYKDIWFYKYPEIELTSEADIYETWILHNRGERIVRYAYLMKEAIERCTSPYIPLSEQQECVDGISAFLEMRYVREVDNFNIALIGTHFSDEEIISNIFFQIMEKNSVLTQVGTVLYEMPFLDESYVRCSDYYFNKSKQKEECVQNEKSESNEIPCTMLTSEELVTQEDQIDKDISEGLNEEDDKNIFKVKEYSKHFWILYKLLLSHNLDVFIFQEVNGITILDYDIDMTLSYDGSGRFFRESGEEIYNMDAIAHEISKGRKQHEEKWFEVDRKAKKHLYNFLSSEQKDSFEQNSFFTVTGLDYYYIIHKEKRYNNILRIEKSNPKNRRSLCLVPQDVHISEFDVMTTVVLLVKSGKESKLNEIAHSFPVNDFDNEIIVKAQICA